MNPCYCLKRISFIVFSLLFYITASAQLKADFAMDKIGGCSPLIINFTNTSTGASSSASYEWDFDNGNSSTLANPSGVFTDEKIYVVTLKVKDGNQTSTTTKNVTVYKKPVVDFSASLEKGCTPLPVTFTANAKADDGTIASYLWDYGDGITAGGSYNQSNHTYIIEQKPSVTLSVTDNHGCTSSKVINEMLTVLPGVTADFYADKTFICAEGDPVKMIDISISDKPLTYLWDFGDGITSTEKNPSHSFNKKATYTVKLAIKNSNGCTSELKKTSYLNVGNFKSGLSIPNVICQNASFLIQNTSSPYPSSSTLSIDNNLVYPNFQGSTYYSFYAAGNHTFELKNRFGGCEETISKTVEIKELIRPKGFIMEIPDFCSMPVKVNFKDTTPGAVKSEWTFESYSDNRDASGTSVSHTYTSQGRRFPILHVANADGCWSSLSQYLELDVPVVNIQARDNDYAACGTLKKKFKVTSNTEIAYQSWNFGDGTTSQEAEPEHTFAEGNYTVTANYTTAKGCKGQSSYNINVTVYKKPKADFVSLTGTTVCGNTIATFERKQDPNITSDRWLVNGLYYGSSRTGRTDIRFSDTGRYTITLIVYNNGCSDTMTRTNYIHVLPSFPIISQVRNTCENNRSAVTISQNSLYAKKWDWDFGDGSTATFNTDKTTIDHQYSKTGSYIITLTTTNGQCINKTSATAFVLMKQQPVLSAAKTTLCMDESVEYQLTNLEKNPNNYSVGQYILDYYQYEDGSKVTSAANMYPVYSTPYNGSFFVDKTKGQFRLILRSAYFNCPDTSNFIPIKLTGGIAGFEILNNNQCHGATVNFRDTSKAVNTTITSREWDFGDGQTLTTTSGGTVSHTYINPGQYNVTLKITDASGCTSSTSSNTQWVYINGPKAAFSVSETNAQLNSTIYFYNQTNNYNSYNTTYEWSFGDGNTSAEYGPSHTYTVAGTYKIRLIASSTTTKCRDTAYQTITVKNFNANFSINTSFLNSTECNSMLVRFQNTSQNYTNVKWDFGDGVTSDNNNSPSHIYTAPGKYIVKLFVTGYNGLSNTYTDSVIIDQYNVGMSANLARTCTSNSVAFSAVTDSSTNYLWDFGDGNIMQAADTFYVYQYKSPGVYHPRIIATKENGCITFTAMKETVIIDSLSVSLDNLPSKICAPKEMVFNPEVINIAGDRSSIPLVYHWSFGTGNIKDTSNLSVPVFEYQQPGNYTVSLKVQSPFGCVKTAQIKLEAFQGLGGKLNGPSSICEQTVAKFTGGTKISGQPTWKWIFEDGTIVNQQNPPERKYNVPGNFLIKLIVDNNGCADTISHTLKVNPNPTVGFSDRSPLLCEGSAVNITASGGTTYQWSPATGLNTTSGATITATPSTDARYVVNVTDANGCSKKDSVKITVVHPFQLQMAKDAAICQGEKIQLTSTGGDLFQWINNTSGLSNTNISSPVATPGTSTVYTIVAKDKNNCFTDTANIQVVVHALPTVDAGMGGEILSGMPFQLHATGSSDIINWTWSPPKYLDCIECPNPISSPLESMIYSVSGKNNYGCIASDTVSIKLFCDASRVYIPNAFSPNNDGLNDYFSILGQGIGQINNFRIYDRWGNLIFNRSNFKANDTNGRWDGKFKGDIMPVGTYNYVVEMSCNGKTMVRKGTVTLLR